MSLLGFLTRQYFPEDPEEERESVIDAAKRSDTYQYLARQLSPDGVDRRSARQAGRRAANTPSQMAVAPVDQGTDPNLPRRLRQEARTGGTSGLGSVGLDQRERNRDYIERVRKQELGALFPALPETPSMRQIRFAEENPGDPLAQPERPTSTPLPAGLYRPIDPNLAPTPAMIERQRQEEADRVEAQRLADANQAFEDMRANPANQRSLRSVDRERYIDNYGRGPGKIRSGGMSAVGGRFKLEDGVAYYMTDPTDPSSFSEIDMDIYEEAKRLTRKVEGQAGVDAHFQDMDN